MANSQSDARQSPLAPLFLALLLLGTFTSLLVLHYISEASYCFLVAATALFALVLHSLGRLQELDLKNLKLTLRQIAHAKQELFVREEQLKAVLVPLAQMLMFSNVAEGRWGSPEGAKLRRQWYGLRLKAIIDGGGVTAEQIGDAQKFVKKYEEIDGILARREGLKTTDADYPEAKARLEQLSKEIDDMLRQDVSS
jgi:hypothetical protein